MNLELVFMVCLFSCVLDGNKFRNLTLNFKRRQDCRKDNVDTTNAHWVSSGFQMSQTVAVVSSLEMSESLCGNVDGFRNREEIRRNLAWIFMVCCFSFVDCFWCLLNHFNICNCLF